MALAHDCHGMTCSSCKTAVTRTYDELKNLGCGERDAFRAALTFLDGKKLPSFSSSGDPVRLDPEGRIARRDTQSFEEHFSAVCGLQLLDHIHLGVIRPTMADRVVNDAITKVEATVSCLF